MISNSISHAQIIEHWNSIFRAQPWIIAHNARTLWTGIANNLPSHWDATEFNFLGFELNFHARTCRDQLSADLVANCAALLRILAYIVNGLEVQPIAERWKWIRLAHFPGLRARACALSDWPEQIAILEGKMAPRKIDFRPVFSQRPLTLTWTIEEVFQHSLPFWVKALEAINGSASNEGPGDLLWEVELVPEITIRIVFQEPDLAEDFSGAATAFFSGESIYLLPVEIAELVPVLVVGSSLQAAEVMITNSTG